MAATAEQLLEQVQKVKDARDLRVQAVTKADASATAAATDKAAADAANTAEDTEIEAFKTMASSYTK